MTNTDKRAGWERMPGMHEIHTGKGKTYRGMVRFERACRTCTEPFGIYVTENVADGGGHNSNFGLRNCEKHRMKMVAQGVNSDELEKLRMANRVMTDELKDMYTSRTAIFAELQVLKAENATLRNKFAPYELQPAMERQAALPADVVGQQLLQKFKEKMPWDG